MVLLGVKARNVHINLKIKKLRILALLDNVEYGVYALLPTNRQYVTGYITSQWKNTYNAV